MEKGCPKYLEKILPYCGIFESGTIIAYIGDISSNKRTNFRVVEVTDLDYLREHVSDCIDCLRVYLRFLNGVRGEKSRREADRDYLSVFKLK